MNELLSKKACEFEKFIECYFVDSQTGLLFSHLNKKTGKEWTADECKGYKFVGSKNDMPAMHKCLSFENSGIVPGAYLYAMCKKYSQNPDFQTRQIIERLWRGIRWNYEISQQIEPGFFCKPYGRKVSNQLSTDQYLNVFKGLYAYYQLADSSTKEAIKEMISSMADFWIRNKYVTDYFGVRNYWAMDRMFPYLLIAFKLTGERRFFDEYNRIVTTYHFDKWTSFSRMKLFRDWWEYNRMGGFPRNPLFVDKPAPSGKIRVGEFLNGACMGIMGLDLCLQYDSDRADAWKRLMKILIDEVKYLYCGNGMAYYSFCYDIENDRVLFADSPHFEFPEKREGTYDWEFGYWHSKLQTDASQLAYIYVIAHRWMLDYGFDKQAADILAACDVSHSLAMYDPDGRQTCPGYEWYCQSMIAPVYWLVAYWENSLRNMR